MGSLHSVGIVFLYYYAGVLVGKVGESLWMSSVCVLKMGQLRTWMTDCSTELVLLLKIGKFFRQHMLNAR